MIKSPLSLNQELEHLKVETLHERKLYARAREADRYNIVSIYLWWVEACKVPGYLEELYQQFNHLKRRQKVKSGINFDRLLYLVYGVEGLSIDDKFNKINVLNQLHTNYLANQAYYEKDPADKLAAWIVEQGGMTKTARDLILSADSVDADDADTTGNDDDYNEESVEYSSDYESSSRERTALSFSFTDNRHSHSTSSNDYDDAVRNGESTLSAMSSAIASATYIVVVNQAKIDVIAESSFGQRYIGINVGKRSLNDVLAQAYSQSYSHLPSLLAAVCEILSLQTPSLALKEPLARLRAKTKDPRKLVGARMLVFSAGKNMLSLTPCSSALGVVIHARLNIQCLPVSSGDYLLSHFARRWTEHSLVTHSRATDFDIASVAVGDQVITVRLEHRLQAAHWSYLDFWLANSNGTRLVNYKLTDDHPILAEVNISFMDFQRFVDEHIDAWIEGIGQHIAREYNQHIALRVVANQLTINFEARADSYKATSSFSLPDSTPQTRTAELRFNSQDFYITLSRLAKFTGIGSVKFTFYKEHLLINLASTGAEYSIVIPAIDVEGMRTSSAAEFLQLNTEAATKYDWDEYLEFDDDMRAEFYSLVDDAAELFED